MVPFLVAILVVVLGGLLVLRFRLRPRPIGKLTLREGQSLGLDFPITTRETTIGSEEGQTVVISHPRVSRRHAVLSYEGGRFVLRDCSQHGVRVNGDPVREAVLRSGDLIRLGESVDVIFTRLV
jgi:pSer/pThr/pTyr-binding forkhead associated (FHA) protein